MLARYIPDRRDKLSFEEAAQVFSGAMAAVLGETPSTAALALALGKTALESGRWGATGGLHCFGFGNIKASSKYEGLYTTITLNEVLGGKLVWFAPGGRLSANPAKGGVIVSEHAENPPGHPQTRMRAFASASDGALDYVRFVAGGRYAKAWEQLLKGDAVMYVHELKNARYFTADEATYARTTLSLQREFIAKLEARPAPETPVPPVEEVREWLSPQDLGELDAAIIDRGRDIVEENQRGALRELSGGEYDDADDSEPPSGIA